MKKKSFFVNIQTLAYTQVTIQRFLMSNYSVIHTATFTIYIVFNFSSIYSEPSCTRYCGGGCNSKYIYGSSEV